MIVTIVVLVVVQFVTLCWLFWLDQEFKLQRRYIQSINAPIGGGSEKPYRSPMQDEPGRFA